LKHFIDIIIYLTTPNTLTHTKYVKTSFYTKTKEHIYSSKYLPLIREGHLDFYSKVFI